jgi:hypothetical protein
LMSVDDINVLVMSAAVINIALTVTDVT